MWHIVGMIYGYARASTDEQTPALQLAALERAGCEKIHEDKGISGTVRERPGLAHCLAAFGNSTAWPAAWRTSSPGASGFRA